MHDRSPLHASLEDRILAVQHDIRHGDERLRFHLARLRTGLGRQGRRLAWGVAGALMISWLLVPRRAWTAGLSGLRQRWGRFLSRSLVQTGFPLLMPLLHRAMGGIRAGGARTMATLALDAVMSRLLKRR